MRTTLLAAALVLAVPGAAQQPDPDSIGLGAMQQIMDNHAGVRDYTVTLAHGAVRMPAYVHLDDGEWTVRVPPEHPLGELLSIAVQWPNMASEVLDAGAEEEVAGTDEARYLGVEDVGGRRAHVVWAGFEEGEADLPDSMRMYVDVETRQLLRLSMSAPMGDEEEDEGGMPFAGDLRMIIDLSDYTARDGLTLPLRMRMRMAADLDMSPQERKAAREQMVLVRAALQGEKGDEAAQMLAMMTLFESVLVRGEMELAVQVEDVRVNSGPPAWLEGSEEP